MNAALREKEKESRMSAENRDYWDNFRFFLWVIGINFCINSVQVIWGQIDGIRDFESGKPLANDRNPAYYVAYSQRVQAALDHEKYQGKSK